MAKALKQHTVVTALQMGWDRLSNGKLIAAAEQASVDVIFTTDQNIQYQQNLNSRRVALVVITGTTKWSQVRLLLNRVASAIEGAQPGSYVEIHIPFERRKPPG